MLLKRLKRTILERIYEKFIVPMFLEDAVELLKSSIEWYLQENDFALKYIVDALHTINELIEYDQKINLQKDRYHSYNYVISCISQGKKIDLKMFLALLEYDKTLGDKGGKTNDLQRTVK